MTDDGARGVEKQPASGCDFIFNIYLLICLHQVLVSACGSLGHVGSRSLTRDSTQSPCAGSEESQPLGHQGSPLGYALRAE